MDPTAQAPEVCTTATTCQAGSGASSAGELNSPAGIALDGAGNLYVADANSQRINVFNTAGPSFTHAFGWGVDTGATAFEVCTTASTCGLGSAGGGAGQLNLPFGVAVDGSGRLYVGDQLNQRIDVFNTAGPSFAHAFGWDVADPDANTAFEVCPDDGTCRQGDFGGGAGQLSGPVGVAVDGAGHLYVGESGNRRISVFNTAGPSFARAFGWDVQSAASEFQVCTSACLAGSVGDGAGQLSGPGGVALDSAGSLYVSDFDNNRLSHFGTAGPSFINAFGWNVANPGGSGSFEVCPTDGPCQLGAAGAGIGQINEPEELATDCRGAVWVADEGNNRVQRFGEPGTPLPPCTAPPSGGGAAAAPTPSSTPAPTGERARALKRCKKKPKGPKRAKCIKKAKRLPV